MAMAERMATIERVFADIVWNMGISRFRMNGMRARTPELLDSSGRSPRLIGTEGMTNVEQIGNAIVSALIFRPSLSLLFGAVVSRGNHRANELPLIIIFDSRIVHPSNATRQQGGVLVNGICFRCDLVLGS